MGFKITNYQAGIRNARREFTGGAFGVLSGGKKTPNDVIERFIASNRSRFNVQKEMYRDLKAAHSDILVDVRTVVPHMWENNTSITKLWMFFTCSY